MNRLILSIFLISVAMYPQTVFQGGIYSDVTWTAGQSPYFITGNVVVFPQKTLTIEPGVEIRITGSYYIEIRGNLIASGIYSDGIDFTRDSINQTDSTWLGIRIQTDQGATAEFKYCSFSNMSEGVSESCCNHQQSVSYRNIIFKNNWIGLNGYNGSKSIVDSCKFYNNYIAVVNADKKIRNSIFMNNNYGLFETERIDVDSSYFAENDIALYGGRGLISNTIIENNRIGIKSFYEGFQIRNSIISFNETGLQLNNYDNFYPEVKNNEICFNSVYNVENLDDVNKDITENCWCTSDSSEIEAKLYDGYDNISRGLLNYSIYDSSCNNEISRVIKVVLGFEDFTTDIKDYQLLQNYPNPFNPDTKIIFALPATSKVQINIYDILGNEIITLINEDKPQGLHVVNFSASGLSSGIYIYRLTAVNKEGILFSKSKQMILLK